MATEIKQLILRRGTTAQWESANPVLAEGEIGLNLDNGRFKVGDGTARWNELAYPDEGMSWRGPWDAGTVYEPRDAVAHDGASYVANVQTVAGDEPGVSAKWDLLAKAGTINGGTLSADLDAAGFRVLGLPTPSVAGEAAPKGYVDDEIDSATSLARARLYHSTTQSIPNATFTVLAFDSEAFDTDNLHDTATNNSRITLAESGVYRFTGQVDFSGTTTTGFRLLNIRANGTDRLGQVSAAPTGATHRVQIATGPVELIAGDYVELYGYQDSGGSMNVEGGTGGTLLTMERIG